MKSTLPLSLGLLAMLAPATASAQEFLLVCDSANDRVMQYNALDGSLINEDFIVNAGGAYNFQTPKEAIQVNGEIWVVDQISDAVYIFDLAGNYVDGITTGLDNVRGGEFINGQIYVTNVGSANGAPGIATVRFDPARNNLGSFLVTGSSPFDPVEFNGEVLISDFASDAIERYDYTGNYLGAFVQTPAGTLLNQPQQISRTVNNTILASGFLAPIGIYEYDSAGVELLYIPTNAGVRGAFGLGNGNIMMANSIGVFVYDRATMALTDVTPPVTGASGQYISLIDVTLGGTIGASYCSPANGNTSGGPASITALGSTTVATNTVTLRAGDMPVNQFGFFLTSMTQGLVMNPGGSNGNLCLSGTIGRYVTAGQIKNSGAGGTFDLALDLTLTPAGPVFVSIAAGETWNFQCWFRDTGPMGQPQSNFTDGRSITFN